MFVENERVFNFNPVDNKTLDKIKKECFRDFLTNLMDYVVQPGEPYPKILNIGVHQYDRFKDRYGKNISYNNKNRQFYQLYTDIKNYVKKELLSVSRVRSSSDCQSGKEPEPNGMHYVHISDTNELMSIVVRNGQRPIDFRERHVYFVDDFTYLFGGGESPYLGISIIRIGNYDYYFYTITR